MSGWRKLDKNEHIKTLQLDTSLLHVTLFLFFVLSLARQVKKVVPAGIQKPVPGRRGLRSWWVGFGCWPHPEWPWRTGRSDCSWCTRSSLRCKRQPRDKQRGPVTNANAVQGPSMRLNFVTSNLELKQQCEVALTYQVWRLTQFFSVSFWWKINDPSSGKHFSLPFLPATPSSPTLEGLFLADTAPFKGPRLTLCIAYRTTEKQGRCKVCHARHWGLKTLSRTADANLDCAFVENELFYTNPWWWKVNRIELS